MDSSDKELELLERIRRNRTALRQRDLARVSGLSLGMTNAILKRLAQKGLLTVRKVNNRNIHYAVTPRGMEQIARRGYRYLRKTIGNVVQYKEALRRLLEAIRAAGYRRLVLVGRSDLDFIVEHFCEKYELSYGSTGPEGGEWDGPEGVFVLYSERMPRPEPPAGDSVWLREYLIAGERDAALAGVSSILSGAGARGGGK